MEYDYRMAKVDWLATAVFLIPSSIWLVNDQKKVAQNLQVVSANGKQEPEVLTNNKQENVHQIQADNVVKQGWGSH